VGIRVLGAFQVSADGDLPHWYSGASDAIPAVDGAMNLVIVAKKMPVSGVAVIQRDGLSA
jgi:3-oxoadipate CoA-transferase, beta subunit